MNNSLRLPHLSLQIRQAFSVIASSVDSVERGSMAEHVPRPTDLGLILKFNLSTWLSERYDFLSTMTVRLT